MTARESYEYAMCVIGGRCPEGEEAISKDAFYAYHYAINIIKGRFPEGEEVIAKDAQIAYFYAKNVIKGRWPEGENAILKSSYAREYEVFIKIRPKPIEFSSFFNLKN